MTTVTSQQLETDPKTQVFADADSRRVLEFLLKNHQTNLTPEILPNDEITYPQLSSILDSELKNPIGFLDKMTSAGVLLAELVDKVPACPECGSQKISTRYICTQCYSYDITRSYLFEHLKCGKVGNDDIFRKGDQIICPKCQTVLHEFGVEYRAVGVWYKCNRCQNSFNIPSHSHFCRPKHHEFTPDRVKLLPIYQYRLNQSALNEIRRQVLVYSEAITLLENLGLTVHAPHALEGKSGQPQTFDLVIVLPKKGWKGAERAVVLDIAISDRSVKTDFVKTFAAKLKEARPSQGFMIAVPGLDDEARSLTESLRLTCFEAPSLKEAVKTLQSQDVFKGYLP